MQTLNYWKQFENTGKIEDYLSYKASDSQRPGDGVAGCKSDYQGKFQGTNGNTHGREGMDGGYAGIHTGDRDDFKAVSHGGI